MDESGHLNSRRGKNQIPEKEKAPENVQLVDTPEALYRIVYETHAFRYKYTQREIGDTDAVAIELSGPFDEGAIRYALRIQSGRERPKFAQHLAERKTPVYFFDIEHDGDLTKFLRSTASLRELESAMGILASVYIYTKAYIGIKDEAQFTRRDFLKMGLAAPLVVKGQLEDERKNIGRRVTTNRQLSQYEKGVMRAREILNPEVTAVQLTLRDALWAYKLKTEIVPDLKTTADNKPNVGMMVGVEHSGLERMLQKEPDELLNIISTVMVALKKVIAIIGANKPDMDISSVARYEYSAQADWHKAAYKKNERLRQIQNEFDS